MGSEFSVNRGLCLNDMIEAFNKAGYLGNSEKLVRQRIVAVSRERKISLFAALHEIAQTDHEVAEAVERLPVEAMRLLRSTPR